MQIPFNIYGQLLSLVINILGPFQEVGPNCEYRNHNRSNICLLIRRKSYYEQNKQDKFEILTFLNMWKYLQLEGILYFIRYVVF